jgi:hypothetical protein
MIDQKIINQLLKANTSSDLEDILEDIKDDIEWVPLGGNPNNHGIISMGSEPYDGITERITNAIDAMIELHVELQPELKQSTSPRSAVEKIYNLKEGNLRYADKETIGKLASNIQLKFIDGDEPKRPTIEIRDRGIGQHPSDFSSTLLSLNQQNKVTKLYLIGAFGQGGQTSFSNCKEGYAIVISRKAQQLLKNGQSDEIGWSIIRYYDPSTEDQIYKVGYYQYCREKKTKNTLTVNPKNIDFAFEHGTIVRLISYGLTKGTSDVLQAANTAWSYISQSLFDPILPIRIFESRERYLDKEKHKEKNRALPGLAPRLWGGGKGESVTITIKNEYFIDLGKPGKIKINYWCLNPVAEPGERINWRDIKKGFVSSNHAIFITLNGQRHGFETTTFLRDTVKLPYASDYLIVQVDCDGLSNMAKKELVSSTRERLRNSDMKDILFNEVSMHLKNDRNILAFEKQQMDRIINATVFKETTKIRKLVGEYILQNKELSNLLFKTSEEKTRKEIEIPEVAGEPPTNESDVNENADDDDITDQELEIPQLLEVPTFLKIANKKDPIPVEKGGSVLIRLETDVNDTYLENENFSRLKFSTIKNQIKEKSHSKLRNGKISYYLFCPTSVRITSKDKITFSLELPDGNCLTTEREIVCVEPRPKKKVKETIRLPDPKIMPLSRNDELWNSNGYDENSVGEIWLKDRNSAILVSIENMHFVKVLKKIDQAMIETTKARYVAAIAYFLLLREVDIRKGVQTGTQTLKNDSDNQDPKSSLELQRLAKTVSVLVAPIENI